MPALEELTKAPEERAAEDRDLETAAREALKKYSPAEKERIGNTLDTIRRLQNDIDFQTFQSVALSAAWTSLHNNPLEAITLSTSGQKYLDLAEKRSQFLLTRNSSPAAREYNLRRYLAGVLGLNLPPSTTAVTFDLISRFASGKPVESVPATGGFKEDVKHTVDMLRQEKDIDYWNRLRVFCRANPVTPADLLCFMQYTQELFPLQQSFVWTSTMDKGQLVYDLVKSGKSASGVDCNSVVMQLVSGLRTGQSILPRAVAANCAALAFAALAMGHTSPSGL